LGFWRCIQTADERPLSKCRFGIEIELKSYMDTTFVLVLIPKGRRERG
jgi:hypothetical protein